MSVITESCSTKFCFQMITLILHSVVLLKRYIVCVLLFFNVSKNMRNDRTHGKFGNLFHGHLFIHEAFLNTKEETQKQDF